MSNNKEKEQGSSEIVNQQEAALPKMLIEEIANKLEVGLISPGTLDKETLAKCALFFKSRRYSEDEIACFLDVTVRTVERYIKKIKMENALRLGENFQKNLISDPGNR